MAHGRDSTSPLQRFRRAARETVPDVVLARERVVLAVGAVTLLALVARLWMLGHRPAHWDEARVAYWALRYEETGTMAYRHIIHGPFIQHVTRPLFWLFGASDFVARLPIALVGGLFPLSALLFREHLRDEETVVFALLLATNSIVLYYGRYYRSDILVAAFMLTAFGMALRYYDTRRYRYVFGAAAFLAFGVASKENAILYVLTWLGALVLITDTSLYRPRSDGSGLSIVAGKLRGVRDGLSADDGSLDIRRTGRWVGVRLLVAVGAAGLFGIVWLYLFSAHGDVADVRPITADYEPAKSYLEVTFWEGVTNPLRFPDLVVGTVDYWSQEYFSWLGTSGGGADSTFLDSITDNFTEFGVDYWLLIATYAMPTVVFAVFGTLRERYAAATDRNLVMFFAYAGFVSALAYPGALDIFGPWNATHAVVPLMIPAAVGIGLVYRWGRRAIAREDFVTAGMTTLVLLLVVGNLAVTAAGSVYVEDRNGENDLVQYGQPADDFRASLDRLHGTAGANEGTDVLVYGDYFVGNSPSDHFLPACMGNDGWFDGLPMPWYLEAADAEVVCARGTEDLESVEEMPPVVLTRVDDVGEIQERVVGWEMYEFRIRTSGSDTALLFAPDAPQ